MAGRGGGTVSKFAGALKVFPGDLERILEELGE
jgi:hypothetical protein